jgi:hypothetical protein
MSFRRLSTALALTLGITSALSLAGPATGAPAPTVAPTAATSTSTTPVIGQPPMNFSVLPGTYFSFPNRSKLERLNIRNRVLNTVKSVWGGPRDALGEPAEGNGTIRMATWSFNDWAMAHALVDARNRGVTVQIVAASSANIDHPSWTWLLKHLGPNLFKAGHPETVAKQSFARQCRGSCRGRGGTPHSKYFLFDNVGAGHHRSIVMSTSMNLTTMAYQGQWNQAQVIWSTAIYNHFNLVFSQTRLGRPTPATYREYASGNVIDIFFPRPGTGVADDPVMQALNQVTCTGATAGTGSHTKIRIIQYAIYDRRGEWISKKLRYLWNRGCDIAIIYAISTRPVISILRSHTGRGPIPMKQSVITNSAHEIVKYNHSKWMTILGNWGGQTGAALSFSGSANWSNSAFSNDEQMQQIMSRGVVNRYLADFSTTWSQSSSHAPGYGQKAVEARMMASAANGTGGGYAPGATVPWGTGAYKYLDPNG